MIHSFILIFIMFMVLIIIVFLLFMLLIEAIKFTRELIMAGWFDYQKYYNILGSNKISREGGGYVKYYRYGIEVTFTDDNIYIGGHQNGNHKMFRHSKGYYILMFRRIYWTKRFYKWFDEYGHVDEAVVKRDKVLNSLLDV